KFEAPEKIAKFDEDMVNQLTNKLKVMGYENLCAIAGAKPTGQKPIILIAVRYYFRCRLEQDPALTNGLNSNRLVTIDVQQEKALADIDQLMTQGEELKKLLTETAAVAMKILSVTSDSSADIKAMRSEIADLKEKLYRFFEKSDTANRPMRIGDGASMSRDSRKTTEAISILKQFEAIKAGNNFNSQIVSTVAKVYSSIGNYDEAVKNFRDAAGLETDSAKKAEEHYNAYMTLLEKKEFDQAILELMQAVKFDRKRFEPIPLSKYDIKRILGAGGFGVVFLCEHREMKSKLAVKSLMLEKLGGDPDRVLDEARIVRQLDSPSIIKIYDCGFMDQKSKERPYIVMEFFDGTDLFDVIEKQGALPFDDALHIMQQAAKGLQAAHLKGVLHRDVKPHNLLVRKENPNENGPQWAVKLIDFGLAMQQKVSDVSTVAQLKTGSTMSGNLVDNSITGTIDYAAPEQIGRRSEKVGKYSDAFGWAKMCCYTLFKTTQPLRTHWKNIPEDIADLLERCLNEDPKLRPNNFSVIIDALAKYLKQDSGRNPKSITSVVGLITSGSVYFLLSFFLLIGALQQLSYESSAPALLLFSLISLAQSAFVVYAGYKLYKMQDFYLVYTGSVLSMLLLFPFCIVLGLPCGIIALLHLKNPDVKNAFGNKNRADF
ncbi:MAG: protein kinase, partial [Alphaproteobacteria bacterium]